MYNSGKIIIGIIVFLVLITSPVWLNLASGKASTVPKPEIVTQEKKCIEPTAYMKTNHMNMLNAWRDSVVRQDSRTYVASDGKQYDMSLTKTCLKCHPNKAQFCDQCHSYEAVKPVCWECHNVPEGNR